MLSELRIRNLGVIEDAVLELGAGLTVVTGETGAGKTMVVQGLALLFGGRSDAGRVRPGAPRAVVEGRLLLAADHPAVVRSIDAGAELDDAMPADETAADATPGPDGAVLIVSRSIGADGRSRAHLGGRGVPVGVLAELSEMVISIHGQSDQQRLLKPARQRAALDRFGGPAVLGPLADYREHWTRWRQVRVDLQRLTAEVAERRREAEVLRLGLEQVAAIAPQAGEDDELRAEIRRLDAADELGLAAHIAQRALSGGETADAVGLLDCARRALEQAAEADPALAELAGRVAELSYLAADVAADVARYASTVEADPIRLASAQDRLAALTGLVRRRADPERPGVAGVLQWAADASSRLLELDGTDDALVELGAEQGRLAEHLGGLAEMLTAARCQAAARFGTAVSTELVELAMPHAEVTASVQAREDPAGLLVGGRRLAAGPDGVDEVELLLAPHPGAERRALHRGASGGELSRLMLAVEVVFAGSDPVPVLVFDEVDAGVGGRAAVEVGRRLARLARDHQVLVVTHLPQVAAFGDQHLQVVKSDDGAVTSSGVVALDGPGRVAELSRMLAGLDSGLARGHAEELLASSRALTSQDSA